MRQTQPQRQARVNQARQGRAGSRQGRARPGQVPGRVRSGQASVTTGAGRNTPCLCDGLVAEPCCVESTEDGHHDPDEVDRHKVDPEIEELGARVLAKTWSTQRTASVSGFRDRVKSLLANT